MDVGRYIDELEQAGRRLNRSARFAGMAAAVPSCSDWTVGDLLRHATHVHHWAAHILDGGDPHRFEMVPARNDAVSALFDDGLRQLVAKLRNAPADLDVWTFLVAESPVAFWARRQAHETSVHCIDAELAADAGVAEVAADFAADGLDELILGFAPGRFLRKDLTAVSTITLEPLDVNQGWTLTIGPDAVTAVPEAQDGSDLTVLGNASDLYRWAWNRLGDDEVSLVGDVTLADVWRRNFRVTWKRR
jgi:uncharacterized protein (TIGR03083 family)